MRDSQILMLIKQELSHHESVDLLRSQQQRIRLEATIQVLSNPFNLIVSVFNKQFIDDKIKTVYKEKTKEYNSKLQEIMVREKLKI